MDDSLGAMDSAFPLEYLALTIAKYVAHMVPGCKEIYCDCESVILIHGRLPRISPYAPLDNIWPAMGLALNLPRPEHVHSHLEKILGSEDLTPGERFERLSRGAKGNVLADWAAYGRRQIFNVVMDLSTLPVEDLLACSAGRSAGWMRLRADTPRLCHNLHGQEDLHRNLLIKAYWLERTQETTTGYIWVHGRSRLAAAAGLVGSKAIAGTVGTIKLIHDKYWWGNRHNPARAPCAYCSAHPRDTSATAPAYTPPLTGIEHWGSDCADPAVVKIRKDSEAEARLLLQEKLAAHPHHLKCALFVLDCMVTQPYRFQGRFDLKSTEIMVSELDIQTGSVTELIQALTDCVRIFLDAGKDIYSLRTPGQTLARARQKAAHKLAQAERQRQSSATLKTKADAKLQRQIAGEAARLAKEQAAAAVERAEEHERAVQPLIVNYFTPPTASASLLHLRRPVRTSKPPRPPSRAGGKRRPSVSQQEARPFSGGIINFLRELRPPSQNSLQSMTVAPLPATPVPWSQDETANQEELYAHFTQTYSLPSHAALLERYRHSMGDYLLEMLVRRCSKHMTDYANDKVTVPLDAPFGEVGFKTVPCLSILGVTWGDVLHFLGYTLAHWTNLTQAVIDHCRPTLHDLPMSSRTDAIPYEEYCAASVIRNSSHTTKRLRARTNRDPPVLDGNYFAEVLDRATAADEATARSLPLLLKDASADSAGSVRLAEPELGSQPSSPSDPTSTQSTVGGEAGSKRAHDKWPSPSIACYFRVVEPLGPADRVSLTGGVDGVPSASTSSPAHSMAAPMRDRPCRPVPLSSATRGLPTVASPPAVVRAPSGELSPRAPLGEATTSSAFQKLPKNRPAAPPLITNFFQVIKPQDRAASPHCEPCSPERSQCPPTGSEDA
jgi:hypothetical protein